MAFKGCREHRAYDRDNKREVTVTGYEMNGSYYVGCTVRTDDGVEYTKLRRRTGTAMYDEYGLCEVLDVEWLEVAYHWSILSPTEIPPVGYHFVGFRQNVLDWMEYAFIPWSDDEMRMFRERQSRIEEVLGGTQ